MNIDGEYHFEDEDDEDDEDEDVLLVAAELPRLELLLAFLESRMYTVLGMPPTVGE